MRQTIKLSGLLLLFCTASFAQDFTADVFNSHSGPDEVAKIFVSGNKVRIEPYHSKGGGFVIWDTGGQHYLVVMPDRRMYMDVTMPILQQQGLTLWRPADVDNACPDWERLEVQLKAREKLGSCHKVGNET